MSNNKLWKCSEKLHDMMPHNTLKQVYVLPSKNQVLCVSLAKWNHYILSR